MRGRGILAAALVALLCGATPAHAQRGAGGVRAMLAAPTSQDEVREGGASVRVRVPKAMRVRLVALVRHDGTASVASDPVTRAFTHRGSAALRLAMIPAGRRALDGCAGRELVVEVLADRGTRAAPAPIMTLTRALPASDIACGARDQSRTSVSTPNADRCEILDESVCMYPFPSDRFTVPDPKTQTGKRIAFPIASMPKNGAGKPIGPVDWNRNDGFSPGSMAITKVPGLDGKEAFARSGLVPITDLERAYDQRQPAVVIDAATGQRQLIWAEVDMNPADPADRTLILRPGKNYEEGHRYVVALRRLVRGDGTHIAPAPAFRALREGIASDDGALEARRAHTEQLFAELARAGIERSDLYLAWDFTVASAKNLAGRALAIRDDAFKRLGDQDLADLRVAGHAPSYTVEKVTDDPDGPTDPIMRRVEGTFQVPCYLNLPGCPSGARFAYNAGDPTGAPAWTSSFTTTARFTCNIPRIAAQGTPLRPGIYGHGLLGSRGELGQGQLRALSNDWGFVFCATDWIGMACADVDVPPDQGTVTNILEALGGGRMPAMPNCDIPSIATMLLDLSNFPSLADRVQQGLVNFMYLGRLLIHPDGLVKDPAFQINGKPAVETGRLYYDGNSQGGIIGGALMALEPDADRGVLGVPGMNYSTLLRRSSDFDTYAQVLYRAYPDELQRPLILALMQMLWDRAEADGYAHHMTTDPYPNTPAHEVILDLGLGDHQVTNWAAEVEARTIGARRHPFWADTGRDLSAGGVPFGIPPIRRYPYKGSAVMIWDPGPLRQEKGATVGTNPSPADEVPNRAGEDPHELPRRSPLARRQKDAFLRIGGVVIDVCGRHPCYAGTWEGPH